MQPPARINGYTVLEYGYFPHAALPVGYTPSQDGMPPLRPVPNLAICNADGVDGYYLLFCAPNWEYVANEFDSTLECAKRAPSC